MSTTDSGPKLGIALDGVTLTAVWREGRLSRLLTVPCSGSPESIATAFETLAESLPRTTAVSIVLARPLAQTRRVRFPAMARATLERVLMRDWSRYIIGTRSTSHTVAAATGARGRWRASFAPTDVLDALTAIARDRGWRMDIRTADDALAGAARVVAPDTLRGRHVLVVCDGSGPGYGVLLHDGELEHGRRFLTTSSTSDVMAFGGASIVSTVVLGGGPHGAALAHGLNTQGTSAKTVDLGLPADASPTAIIATAALLSPPVLPLRSTLAQLAHHRAMRRTTVWLLFATAAALLVGLALEQRHVDNTLRSVKQARAELAPSVRDALLKRTKIEREADVANTLRVREANASRTTGVIAAVTLALPLGASLTSLHVTGDSVTVEGESSRSAAVYEALRQLPQIEQLKLAAPFRQDRLAGDISVEHFAFSARVRRTAAGAK